jgi:hypothetical protein
MDARGIRGRQGLTARSGDERPGEGEGIATQPAGERGQRDGSADRQGQEGRGVDEHGQCEGGVRVDAEASGDGGRGQLIGADVPGRRRYRPARAMGAGRP